MFALECEISVTEWPQFEALLEAFGALAITQSDGDVDVFAEPDTVVETPWSRFKAEALFADIAEADTIEQALRQALPGIQLARRPIDGEAWAERWKEGWTPLSFSGGVCVCPSWLEPPPTARHVVSLDPGQAFGTGSHQSTGLCIDWLVAQAPFGDRTLLDYGCGSGILALVAARLGARNIKAVDIDARAVLVTRENIELNHAQDDIEVSLPGELAATPVQMLVANILLGPLLKLAPEFVARVAPGGRIAMAGLLQTQIDSVLDAYTSDFEFEPAVVRDEWALLAGRRRPAQA